MMPSNLNIAISLISVNMQHNTQHHAPRYTLIAHTTSMARQRLGLYSMQTDKETERKENKQRRQNKGKEDGWRGSWQGSTMKGPRDIEMLHVLLCFWWIALASTVIPRSPDALMRAVIMSAIWVLVVPPNNATNQTSLCVSGWMN